MSAVSLFFCFYWKRFCCLKSIILLRRCATKMLICIKVVLFFPRLSLLIDYNCLKVPFSLVCLPHITNSRLSCVRLRQADVVVLSVEVFCIRGSIIQDPFEVSIPLVFGLSGLGSVFLFWGDGANGGITRSCLGAPSLYHLQNLAWGSGWRSVQLLIKPKFDLDFEAISQIVSSFLCAQKQKL